MPFSLPDDAQTAGPLVILTVCTGNICRSPLAEGLLRMKLAGLPVEVRSAGTSAMIGAPMSPENRRIAAELGVPDGEAHRARQLSVDDVRSADLVLALTRAHRRAVVELQPRASRHTFTLREFGRLAAAFPGLDTSPAPESVEGSDGKSFPEPVEGIDATRLRDIVEAVAQLRGSLPPLQDPSDDDVVDPYRQGEEVYARSAAQLIPPVEAAVALLRQAAQPPVILREAAGSPATDSEE